jgi:hypothetical protein
MSQENCLAHECNKASLTVLAGLHVLIDDNFLTVAFTGTSCLKIVTDRAPSAICLPIVPSA